MQKVRATVLPNPHVTGAEFIASSRAIAVPQHWPLVLGVEAMPGRRSAVAVGGG